MSRASESLTPANKAWLRENSHNHTIRAMADKLDIQFQVIHSFLRYNKLQSIPDTKHKRLGYTWKSTDDFILITMRNVWLRYEAMTKYCRRWGF
jgi:hypothetical protein